MKQLMILAGLIATTSVFAFSPAASSPHFNLVMENRSDKDVNISFQQEIGYIDLDPVLNDHTPLSPHSTSLKYAVNFYPLDPKDTFNIVFTGKQNCTFNIAFYAPANPKVTISGLGCYGGGYSITDGGYTLLLYVSDIHLK